jgi:F-type H+-transporting ATP synthase subunit e
VRYTALFSGVLYGWFHRRTLQVAHDQHKLEEAAHHRGKLVAEAKDAWKRKQESAKDTTGNFFLYAGILT